MKQLAQGIASLGRGDDTMLVHMSPIEVKSLQAMAQQHGGSLTINPHTGLPEAGFLSAILPIAAGIVGNMIMPGIGGALGAGLASYATDGQKLTWEILQDGTGNRVLTPDTQFAFGYDLTGILLTTNANKRDFITAIYNSGQTKWYVTGIVRGY